MIRLGTVLEDGILRTGQYVASLNFWGLMVPKVSAQKEKATVETAAFSEYWSRVPNSRTLALLGLAHSRKEDLRRSEKLQAWEFS